ncbi:hypothetical protein AALD22_08310 [Lachnospiraceae bacterium 56-18]|jgi:type I restriction-modification system DNA methylase subunit
MKKIFQGIITMLAGTIAGIMATRKILLNLLRKNQENAEKFQILFQMMNQWVELKQKGINLSQFFEENGYKKIAIYGMSSAGEALCNELKDSDIEITYAVDKNKYGVVTELEVYAPDEELPDVDVIVVSAVAYYDEIAAMLEEKVKFPIVSLEDIVYNVY